MKWITSLLAIASLGLPVWGDSLPLQEAQVAYELRMTELDLAFRHKAQEVIGQYLKALDGVREQYRQAGALDGVMATERERERLVHERVLPGELAGDALTPLRLVQTQAWQDLRGADTRRRGEIRTLSNAYLGHLERLQKRLVQADRIKEALNTKQEIERVRSSVSRLASENSPPEVRLAVLVPVEELMRGRILHYDFGKDDKGKVADRSGKGHDGSVHGPRWKRDPSEARGGVLAFDGKDDYIEHACPLPRKNGTIAHWLQPADLRCMVGVYESDGHGDGFGSRLGSLEVHTALKFGRRWGLLFQDGEALALWGTSSVAPTTGLWTHVVVTWNGAGDAVVYVDGNAVERGHLGEGNRLGVRAKCHYVGRPADPRSDKFWSGRMDDVIIWDRALSSDEILQLYDIQAGE